MLEKKKNCFISGETDGIMSVNEHFQNPLFRYWVSTNLALKYTRDALLKFIWREIKDKHTKYIDDIMRMCSISVVSCINCNNNNLLPKHLKPNCPYGKQCWCKKDNRRSCPASGSCGMMYDMIIDQHVHHNPNWRHSMVIRWLQQPGEIAKCYIGGHVKDDFSKKTVDQLDIVTLISICLNNLHIVNKLKSCDILDEVRCSLNLR